MLIKSKSSPTESLDVKNIKKCSNLELKMLARALNERLSNLCDDEDKVESSPASSQSSEQGSISSKDPYNSELFQDG